MGGAKRTQGAVMKDRVDAHSPMDAMLDQWRPDKTVPVRDRLAALLLIRLWLQLVHPGKLELLEGFEREIAQYIDHPAMKDGFEIFKQIKVQAFVNRVRRELMCHPNGTDKGSSNSHWN